MSDKTPICLMLSPEANRWVMEKIRADFDDADKYSDTPEKMIRIARNMGYKKEAAEMHRERELEIIIFKR